MIAEARRQPGCKVLRSIPCLGDVRVALILAIMATPGRFRTRRQSWPYVGLAVVTRSSADQEFAGGGSASEAASTADARDLNAIALLVLKPAKN